MSFRSLNQRIETAVDMLSGLLAEQPLRVACSGGKDSSVCLVLAMRAARSLIASGREPMPVILSSSDTGVENPEVSRLLRSLHDSALRYGDEIGLEVMADIVRPNLLEQWWPRMLAGRKLPSYIGSQGDCSVDMKIKPQQRLARRLARRLKERGLPEPITVVGTRRDESAQRAANMADRGDRPDEVVNGVIAPIADWSTDDVMVTLIDREIERFPHDYAQIINFYGDSAGGECMVTPERRLGAAQGGCTARSGCFTCQKVGDDRSLSALVQTDRYDYLEPLLRLNRYLGNIRWDLTRRSWLGRDIDPATGCVRLAPNCLSFEECDRLLRMVLTIDRDEIERADSVAAAIAEGEIADTDRNRQLARPQFRNIDEAAIVAIDFLRGVDCFGPAHSALVAWRDVFELGLHYPVLEIEAVERPDALPEPSYARLDLLPGHGLFDPALSAASDANHAVDADQAGEWFDVDQADAAELLAWSLDEWVDLGRRARSPASAALRYLRAGVITLSRGYESTLDRNMARAQALYDAGLRPAPMLPTGGVLSESEHRDRIWQIAVDHGVVKSADAQPSGAGGWRRLSSGVAKAAAPRAIEASPAYVAEQVIGLTCAEAEGVHSFDGSEVTRALRAARRQLRALAVDEESEGALLLAAWRRALRYVQGQPLGDEPCGLLPWLALGEDRLKAVAPPTLRQPDLFDLAA